MADFAELMRLFSVPRPSGSAAERHTRAALLAWLSTRGIAHQTQRFRLYPLSNELIGLWLIVCATALVLAATLRWPWPALALVATAIMLVIANVVLGVPLVVWPIATTGENVLITIEPRAAIREFVIATHYDSKTELFDHPIQGALFRRLPLCIALAAIVLLLGALDRALLPAGSLWSDAVLVASVALALPAAVIVGAVGLNLLPGRLLTQSQGAVDNGAACAIVLGLAERLAHSSEPLCQTRVTLALFGGEEVSMQGSRAYVRSRHWTLPTLAVNLELMGQRGRYVIWQREGNVLTSAPTDAALSALVATVVAAHSGREPLAAGTINSDGYSFVRAGIPCCVLGSYDPAQAGGGLHRPTDKITRVAIERLAERVAMLEALVRHDDCSHASDV
jgi:hypothetical protein